MKSPKGTIKLPKYEKPPYFRSLRWKMAAAFVFLTYCLFIVLGTIGGLVEYAQLREEFAESADSKSQAFIYWSGLQGENIFSKDQADLKKDSHELLSWLATNPKNSDAIRLWLTVYSEKLKLHRKNAFLNAYSLSEESGVDAKKPNFHFIIFDRSAQVVTSSEGVEPSDGEHAEERKFIDEIVRGDVNEKKDFTEKPELQIRIGFPITDAQNKIQGALFFRETLPLSWTQAMFVSIPEIFSLLLPNFIFFSVLGFIFGSPFVWYLSRRLKNIASAAQSWRTGDFSARTNDRSSDEIGILSRRLNEMAEDLRENFALRQTIATAEERNRIARDLHDSVKQQVFGLAMQISTAKALLENNPTVAKTHLGESEKLVGEIQQELVNLIRELSVINGEAENFREKIESLTNDWARQNKMKVNLISEVLPPFSPIIVQSFYRIVQESLGNIARHSQASEINIKIEFFRTQKLQLTIADNGCGFDPEQAAQGFGLRNMRERAEQLPNGWLSIRSEIGKGTELVTGCDVHPQNGAKQ
jgi:signal transduction histidine kinase